jgi:hypothetical protein
MDTATIVDAPTGAMPCAISIPYGLGMLQEGLRGGIVGGVVPSIAS